MGAHGVRPKRGVHEARGVYGQEQQMELEGRQIRYRKCKAEAREGISEFFFWQVEFAREEVQAWPLWGELNLCSAFKNNIMDNIFDSYPETRKKLNLHV